jgi:hypothetical protein
MRVIWFAAMLGASAAIIGPVEAETSALFGELEAGVNTIPVAPEMKAALLDMVSTARAHSDNGVTSPLVVVDLLQAFTSQLAELLLVTGEESIVSLIAKSDQVCAELFFDSGPLVVSLPPLPVPPPQQCTVRILTRLIGPVLNDPAGILYLRFPQLVQFEAQASEEGGLFDWFVSPTPELPIVYSRGPRLSMRVADPTFAVGVRYQKDAKVCTDLILLRVQGSFPD